MEQGLPCTVRIAGQVLQSAAGAAPIWKTLEMTDIQGAT
jgi:hypothetical protein